MPLSMQLFVLSRSLCEWNFNQPWSINLHWPLFFRAYIGFLVEHIPVVLLSFIVISPTGGSSLKITDQMLCAGVEGQILSGCHGDSGGPYVCQNSNGSWVLQGAVSWGSPRCSAKERFTVFARVSKFRNWIDQLMGANPPPPNTPAPPNTPSPPGGRYLPSGNIVY